MIWGDWRKSRPITKKFEVPLQEKKSQMPFSKKKKIKIPSPRKKIKDIIPREKKNSSTFLLAMI